jgi:hypothetical protein
MASTLTVADTLRDLVREIRAERGDTEEYLIVDDLLKRLPALADRLDMEACTATAEALKRAFHLAKTECRHNPIEGIIRTADEMRVEL